MSVPQIHFYAVGRCLMGVQPCNRRASHVHVRSDVHPPLVMFMCETCHAEVLSNDLQLTPVLEDS